MARAAKIVVTALFLTLFSAFTPAANADFYTPEGVNLPNNPSLYYHFDQSSSGTVIATADGCRTCFEMIDNGYAQISTNGGVTFTEVTSIGTQSWRAVEVSSDGTRIALFAGTAFFISTDTGATFTKVDALTPALLVSGSEIIDGAISGDGNTIFIAENQGSVAKFTYKSSLRKWSSDLWVKNYADREPTTITTNYAGTKTYIGSNQTGIAALVGSAISLLANTETWNGEILQWGEVRTSDSGSDIVALAGISSRGGTVFRSTNGGTSFSAITSVNGQNVPHVTAVEISGDGNATFFGTVYWPYVWIGETTLYTQHGKSAAWYTREVSYDNAGFTQFRSNQEGSILVTGFDYGFLRIFKGAPSAPSITDISIASPSSLTVNWASGFDPGSDTTQVITDVVLEYATSNSGPWTTFNDGVSGGNTGTITVTGLNARTDYYFRIKSKNSYGTSGYSEIRSSFIYEKPSTPLAPRVVSSGLEDSYGFEFKTSSDYGGASYLTENDWQYSFDSGTTWYSSSSATFRNTRGLDGYTPVLFISEVTPGSRLSIRSRNSNGLLWSDWSPASTVIYFKKPTAPDNFQVNTVFTNATLTWNPPTDMGGETVARYNYGYKRTTDSGWTRAQTTDTTTTISGLTGGASYDYQVYVETARGTLGFISYKYNSLASSQPVKLAMNRNSSDAKSGLAMTVQPKISVLDVNNSIITTDSLSTIYAEVNKGGTLIGTDSATAVSGVATFTNLGIKGVAGTQYTITYRSGNLVVASETITLQVGAKAYLRFTQNTVGGVNNVIFPTQAAIELLDSDGNRVTWDDTTTVTITTNNGFLSDNSSLAPVRASRGLVTFSNVKIVGGNGSTSVLTYSTSGLASIQETITITTGAATRFTRTVRAQDGYIGGKFGVQPVYQILDAGENVVTSGEYYISVSPSRGTLTGQTTVKSVNGVVTFTDLGIVGVEASQLVTLSVYSNGFTTYTGDSIITRQSKPRLSWTDFYIPRGYSSFTIPAPESNTAGTFTYTSSNSSIVSFSGSTVTVGNAGTATVTATFTPTNTSTFSTGETVTSTFTVTPAAGTLVVSVGSGGALAKGVTRTLTASASDSGYVTFYINGKRLAGCISVKTQSTTATCNWKPTTQGSVTLTALLVPTNTSAQAVNATPLNLTVARRTTRR